ncbi:MAG: RsbRD N-terminal domain-containing protein [Actinobacteria bacterium]|nr:RsbRD N-terminal domain-containing protein [Actinomycetota bacterium]
MTNEPIEPFGREVDPRRTADLLTSRRDEILQRWLVEASQQPFHREHPDNVVADHIPELFDALVQLLPRTAHSTIGSAPPLDDPTVLEPAQAHASTRFAQGLRAVDVVTEFRLLRQEIGRALRVQLDNDAPTAELDAEMLVHDVLDGAIALALSALTRQVEDVREDFLAGVLHDVQQPITTVRGSLQLALHDLEESEPDPKELQRTLRRAEAATNQMVVILTNLANVSRLALGEMQLQVAAADLSRIVGDALARLHPDDAARVHLEVAKPVDTRGEWDPRGLGQVISNLLSNALKYSPPNTPVSVTLSGDADGVQVAVQDRGIGLAPEDHLRLFRRHSRTERVIGRHIDGLGLGLYLSRGIVEAHSGRIWAESPGADQGTTMYVALPRRAPSSPLRPRRLDAGRLDTST